MSVRSEAGLALIAVLLALPSTALAAEVQPIDLELGAFSSDVPKDFTAKVVQARTRWALEKRAAEGSCRLVEKVATGVVVSSRVAKGGDGFQVGYFLKSTNGAKTSLAFAFKNNVIGDAAALMMAEKIVAAARSLGTAGPDAPPAPSAFKDTPANDSPAQPAPAAQPSQAIPYEPSVYPIRWRLGINGAFTLFIPGFSYGGDVSIRGGAQFLPWLGAYAEVGGGLGGGGSAYANNSGVSVALNLATYWRLGAMVDFSYGSFFFALGPALFRGSWASLSQSAATDGTVSQTAYAVSGYYPAAVARLGGTFGNRQRFTIALEAMVVFGKMTQVSQTAGGGVDQSAQVGSSAIGYVPGVVLGWDMR